MMHVTPSKREKENNVEAEILLRKKDEGQYRQDIV